MTNLINESLTNFSRPLYGNSKISKKSEEKTSSIGDTNQKNHEVSEQNVAAALNSRLFGSEISKKDPSKTEEKDSKINILNIVA